MKDMKAVNYIRQHARPLEKALYAHYFKDGSLSDVLTELAKFQNSDGGFGHALEPDLRLKDSSVIATTIAFQTFRALGLTAQEPIVVKASDYLKETYDSQNKVWPIIPPNISDAPHAPWWTYKGDPQEHIVNPTAEILGYFYEYPDLFSSDIREKLTNHLVSHLKGLDEIEMHELQCYIRLVESPNLPSDIKMSLVDLLKPLVLSSVTQDPAGWGEYGLTPLSVVSSPESPFYDAFKPLITQNLDFVKASQSPEGYWSPAWNWEFASEEGWRVAERDLRGILTLVHLRMFEKFAE